MADPFNVTIARRGGTFAAVPAPSPEDQVRFLLNVQRLLNEGAFTASYKYGMLLALADIAVESGDDSGAPLALPIERIAEKYIAYYWRQAVPYIGQGYGAVCCVRTTLTCVEPGDRT